MLYIKSLDKKLLIKVIMKKTIIKFYLAVEQENNIFNICSFFTFSRKNKKLFSRGAFNDINEINEGFILDNATLILSKEIAEEIIECFSNLDIDKREVKEFFKEIKKIVGA